MRPIKDTMNGGPLRSSTAKMVGNLLLEQMAQKFSSIRKQHTDYHRSWSEHRYGYARQLEFIPSFVKETAEILQKFIPDLQVQVSSSGRYVIVKNPVTTYEARIRDIEQFAATISINDFKHLNDHFIAPLYNNFKNNPPEAMGYHKIYEVGANSKPLLYAKNTREYYFTQNI